MTKVPVKWWIASVVSAVLAAALTASTMVVILRQSFAPVKTRLASAVPAKAPRGEVTIYELFGCSRQLSQCERDSSILPLPGVGVVPNRFPTLALCQGYASRYIGVPPDKDGRWEKSSGAWLQCLARRTFPWYQPERGS